MSRNFNYKSVSFLKTEFNVKNKKFGYYLSPIFYKYNFKHGFLTKSISKEHFSLLEKNFNENPINCVLNQIHSNKIIFGSNVPAGYKIDGDGIVSDNSNQNLWIYTADCMPIFFADKKKRLVAAIHCGRRGLEKRIIKKMIKIFDESGSLKDDVIVAIGPSISEKHYLIDNKTLYKFHENTSNIRFTKVENEKKIFYSTDSDSTQKEELTNLDLRKYAYMELVNGKIPSENIDISSLCTYETKNEFHSWRRNKTLLRQWNFIYS